MSNPSTEALREFEVIENGNSSPGQSVPAPSIQHPPPNSMSKLWVLLPAYNEQAAIATLIEKIFAAGEKCDYQLEVVVVDDASQDNTARIVSQLSFDGPVCLLQHKQNEGLAGAMRTGFNHILEQGHVGDAIVSLDADDTQPPATIPKMLTMLAEGYDVVIASRYQIGSRTVGVPKHRLVMTWFAKWLFKLVTPIPGVWDYTCGFRGYRFEALKKTSDHFGNEFVSEQGFSCMVDVLLKMRRFGFVMGEVPMLLRYDQKVGLSKMNVTTTALQTIKLLVKRRLQG